MSRHASLALALLLHYQLNIYSPTNYRRVFFSKKLFGVKITPTRETPKNVQLVHNFIIISPNSVIQSIQIRWATPYHTPPPPPRRWPHRSKMIFTYMHLLVTHEHDWRTVLKNYSVHAWYYTLTLFRTPLPRLLLQHRCQVPQSEARQPVDPINESKPVCLAENTVNEPLSRCTKKHVKQTRLATWVPNFKSRLPTDIYIITTYGKLMCIQRTRSPANQNRGWRRWWVNILTAEFLKNGRRIQA
jgi:hypothetical protein